MNRPSITSLHAVSQDWARALYDYVMDSGRLLVLEVDPGPRRIVHANVAFRSRFAGFADVRGQSLDRFLDGEEDLLDLPVPGDGDRPMARLVHTLLGGEACLFHAYPLETRVLLIGEVVEGADHEVVGRMGNLALDMSRLVRDLRKANQALARANALNEQLARTDALTGLANRGYFMERLAAGVAQAHSRGHRLSVVMVDLDHFKEVNDRYGHAAGDAVLVALAGLLREVVRASDLSGRLGGEEFGIFLFDSDGDTALAVAERVRAGLARQRPLEGDYRPSASLGVAELSPGEADGDLMRRADAALYAAKGQGRDRVVLAPPPG
ncbi:GGDEF domain-containing protein [Ectothiorhodospira mobilis]|uniref:GGDEF domain-containing protein n=1 Tax=Ectothiorhodospira mobilis TaxID=195064 RepID=UPI0019075A80|nr:GGDEF domain-containing protein [Ectothiorhodospira mobilis]MBK1693001.1 GGDEF domain-containing protein [Ectothiorhodospira mobilis]